MERWGLGAKIAFWSVAVLTFFAGLGVIDVLVSQWLADAFDGDPPDASLPAIVRGLPDESGRGDAEFQRRMHARFPDGMAETSFTAALRQQGFTFAVLEDGQRAATIVQQGTFYHREWNVFWYRDKNGRAIKITPGFLKYGWF